jgi:hypothetical protein
MVDVARSGNFARDLARAGIWPENYVKLKSNDINYLRLSLRQQWPF